MHVVTNYVRRQEYDLFQNRGYRESGNGVHTEYNFYPGTLRFQQQLTTSPSRKIRDLNYGYDAVGNVTSTAPSAQRHLGCDQSRKHHQ